MCRQSRSSSTLAPVPGRQVHPEYFLWKVFDRGNTLGIEVVASEDQKAYSKGRTPEEQRVTGEHQAK
jgi:hypothetical protein